MDPVNRAPIEPWIGNLIDASDEGSEEGEGASSSSDDIDGSQAPINLRNRAEKENVKPLDKEKNPFEGYEPHQFLSDTSIDGMHPNKVTKDCLLHCRKIIQDRDNRTADITRQLVECQAALARQTGKQASDNQKANKANRLDFSTLNRENASNTVLRVGSLVLSVAMAILAFVLVIL